MAKKTAGGTKKKTATKIDLSAPVSQRVELKSLFLIHTKTQRQPYSGELPTNISVNINVNVNTVADKQQGIIQVQPHFTLVSQLDDQAGSELLRIEAIFMLLYHMPSFEGLLKSNLDAFGEMNGVFNVWPYWREFVQSTTLRMGLPALTVPVYRPTAPTRSKAVSTSRTPRPKRAKKTVRV